MRATSDPRSAATNPVEAFHVGDSTLAMTPTPHRTERNPPFPVPPSLAQRTNDPATGSTTAVPHGSTDPRLAAAVVFGRRPQPPHAPVALRARFPLRAGPAPTTGHAPDSAASAGCSIPSRTAVLRPGS